MIDSMEKLVTDLGPLCPLEACEFGPLWADLVAVILELAVACWSMLALYWFEVEWS